jgi:hypothetical protein
LFVIYKIINKMKQRGTQFKSHSLNSASMLCSFSQLEKFCMTMNLFKHSLSNAGR